MLLFIGLCEPHTQQRCLWDQYTCRHDAEPSIWQTTIQPAGYEHVHTEPASTSRWVYRVSLFISSTVYVTITLKMWFFLGGPGLDTPYRPARNPQMNKMMPTRPSYPGMMPGMQGSMPGMMGLDKQYPMGYKPQPSVPQMLRHQLQVRLVSQSALTGHTAISFIAHGLTQIPCLYSGCRCDENTRFHSKGIKKNSFYRHK